MSRSIETRYEDLPSEIAVFPMRGILLLPRSKLPLNIYEPRYLAMTEDALGEGRLIGMIQPVIEENDDEADDGGEPTLQNVGCAGRITSMQETDDGRFLITLKGVSRFRVTEEVEGRNGYRRVAADWEEFEGDFHAAEQVSFDREGLIAELQSYLGERGEGMDWDAISSTPDETLINTLAMVCPFAAPEKQALLESVDLVSRAEMMIAIMEYAAQVKAQSEDGDAGDVRH